MWTVHVPHRVEKELNHIPSDYKETIFQALDQLQHNPRPAGVKHLRGVIDAWRIRIGNYRVIYRILLSERTIVILKIGHRKDVYR